MSPYPVIMFAPTKIYAKELDFSAPTKPKPDWKDAQKKAAKTARWAVTMTKLLITKLKAKTTWKLITFGGKKGGESVGIVDMMAIRKNHSLGADGLKRGDVFEIILIQVKGGGAALPTPNDVRRLITVGRRYAAKAVILAAWKKGKHAKLYQLDMDCDPEGKTCWELLECPRDLFH